MLSRFLVRDTKANIIRQIFEPLLDELGSRPSRRAFCAQVRQQLAQKSGMSWLDFKGTMLRSFATQSGQEAPKGPSAEQPLKPPQTHPAVPKQEGPKDSKVPPQPGASTESKAASAQSSPKDKQGMNSQKAAPGKAPSGVEEDFYEDSADIGRDSREWIDYKAMRTKKSTLAWLGNGVFFLLVLSFAASWTLYKFGVSEEKQCTRVLDR